MIIVHPCRSKQEAAAFPVSQLASCLVPSNHPPRCPLPVARCPLPHSLRSSVSFLVPLCVSSFVSFSCRLVSRPVPRLVPSCQMCRTLAAAPFCSAHFLRSSHALPSSSSHDRMTQDGHGYRIMTTPTERASNERTSSRGTRRMDIEMIRQPSQGERPIKIRKIIRRIEKKTRRVSKTPPARRYNETEGRQHGIERDATGDTQMRRTERASNTRRGTRRPTRCRTRRNENDTGKQ